MPIKPPATHKRLYTTLSFKVKILFFCISTLLLFRASGQNQEPNRWQVQAENIDSSLVINTTTSKLSNYQQALWYTARQESLRAATQLNGQNTTASIILLSKLYAKINDVPNCLATIKKYLEIRHRMPYTLLSRDTIFTKFETNKEWQKFWDQYLPSKKEEKYISAQYDANFSRETDAILAMHELAQGAAYWPALLFLANYYEQHNNPKDALFYNQKAIQTKASAPLYLQQTQLLLTLKKTYEAGKSADKALLFDDCPTKYFYTKALVFAQSNEPDSCETYLQQYAQYCAPTSENYYQIGQVYDKISYHLEALQFYTKAIRIRTTAKYLKARGITYTATHSDNYAIDDLTLAMDLDPTDAELFYYQGQVFYRLQKKDLACKAWQRGMRLGSNPSLQQFNLHCTN
ncbi:MAG: hypothetical protein RIS47_43 [Bacteroidota bacterium]